MFNFVLKRATYQAARQPIHRYCNYVSLHSAHDGQGGGGAGVVLFREFCAELEKARSRWDEQRRQENDQLQKARREENDQLQKARREENDQLRNQLLDRLQKAADDHRNHCEKLRSEIGDLKMHAMGLKDSKLRLEQNFNVRGGLERIVFHATLEGQLKRELRKAGVQKKLDHLAELADFKAILQKEVAAHKLVYDDAWSCVKKIYHEVSKHAHENTEPIVLDRRYFTPNELVVLTAFFRLQEKWSSALEWKKNWGAEEV